MPGGCNKVCKTCRCACGCCRCCCRGNLVRAATLAAGWGAAAWGLQQGVQNLPLRLWLLLPHCKASDYRRIIIILGQ